MSEKIKQALASVKGYATRKDDHLPTSQSSDEEALKRKKRIKLFTYIGIFVNCQIIVMIVFGLTVMKVKTPKVRLRAIDVEELNSIAAMPSFDTRFMTQIRIKNTNWGPYKFDGSVATFMYQGVPIGQVSIPMSKAGMRSTKKINVEVSLNTAALPSGSSTLGGELSSGVLTLTSEAKLTGKVELMLVMKKMKSANMDCTLAFDLATKSVKSLLCK